MKIQVVSLNEETIRFLIQGADVAFVNALRRTMISEVPIMAIEDIFYFDNSSMVPDEVLAHRIGMTPLKTDLENYVLPEDCDCKAELGCPRCRTILTLDVETADETITVYSGDLIPEDPELGPASKRIPLAKIAKGQTIRFEAYAQLGLGKIHPKWSPVSMCVYQNVSLVSGIDSQKAQKCIDASGDAAVLEGDKIKVIDILKFESCKICRELVPHDLIMDNLIPDEFLFTAESIGALRPEVIVKHAVKVLKQKLAALDQKVAIDDVHDVITDFEITEPVEEEIDNAGLEDDAEEDGTVNNTE